ncbi:hypothetical protein [Chitinophaga sp. sic0106]|uniref:hypothetical protein n=1 Tax=Chitinophaga sp. sic0106 TaxID=2854785 RepID=UPI001C472631|nr:hypothetical protein [Chitinophaga sp. sic0106]MBV7529038.1 hypothetical protein [Chitinophaga sp. sic0106]
MDRNIKIALILSAVDRASAVLGRAFTNAEKRAKAFEKAGKTMSEVGDKSLIGGAAVSAGLLGTLKAAADVERMQVALRTSFKGSAEEANKAFNIINQFAAATPYGLEEVMTGFIKLKNMGLDPSLEALTAYGNTASAMGKSLNDMVEAVADAATGEFERLKEFGIKASTQGNKVVFTFQGVKTVVRKEAADIEKYLKKVGGVNFAGGIEAQSKTLYGQWSTLADNARMVTASLGKLLIPAVNNLFARLGPVLDRIQRWIDANPVLATQIMTVASKVAIALLAFGGAMKVLGFVTGSVGTAFKVTANTIKGVNWLIKNGGSIAVTAVKAYDKIKFAVFALQYAMKFTIIPALRRVSIAFIQFGATLLANPITWYIAAAVALGAAVYFIIKNWDKISAFFSRLWQNVKNVFSRFWGWAKFYFLNFTPYGLIIKHWSKIVGMFSGVWNSVKSVFTSTWNWIANLGSKFYDAGKNIVMSIAKGIWAVAMAPVKGIEWIVKKIRAHLPFSPAKEGPLRDIHKIKLVETIAQSMNARPLLDAWRNISGRLFGQMSQPAQGYPRAGVVAASGGGPTFHLTVNLTGGATKKDADNIFDSFKMQADRWWRDKQNSEGRRSF